ncbi:DUF1572 family protein [Halpernia frigidisoli]|uniref:DUF1572 domain-containing protein n=1 Tax=Halpernia frigidisoli TaxID=1125876 RepID=A0A1I3HUH3_9FLAO|nr:DUF1572 family protein [Halpernia frigidisoli]SFI39259.1 Protein of unknown function [Halpernia frigidisoli]
MIKNFLESSIKQFEYYKMLGDKTFSQLSEEHLFLELNKETNSIAIIVNHLNGNMLSRWSDFLTTDGEKDWRNRDNEFENRIQNETDLLKKWNEGWDCLLNAITPLTVTDFETEIFIRNQGHTVIEAINRQLAHYSYHVGQIVLLGKIFLDEKWISLSIPKGNSQTYNSEKFSKPKIKKHFTDEYLNENKKAD